VVRLACRRIKVGGRALPRMIKRPLNSILPEARRKPDNKNSSLTREEQELVEREQESDLKRERPEEK
jgi:hypothetical protein